MINAVLDVQEESQIYPYGNAEPLGLEDAKAYMMVDYDDHDDLITSLIVVARESLESYLGSSLVEKRLTVQLQNECGNIEIPYGPTPDELDVSLITDIDGNVVDSSQIVIVGNQFKVIVSPCASFLQLVYTSGYTTLPASLLTALKAQVFFLYQNRGEKMSGGNSAAYVCDAAKELSKRHRRVFDNM